jgi:prophage antirepressor-like protein
MNKDVRTPLVFLRYQRPLRALMIDGQPWFAAHDVGCLIGRRVEQLAEYRLDADLKRREWLSSQTGEAQTWLISDAALFSLLQHFRHPEHPSLRRWLVREVIPTLRDSVNEHPQAPRRQLLRWVDTDLSTLHWQDDIWVRFVDVPCLMPMDTQPARRSGVLRRLLDSL